jgi:outer membrane lipoprotein SlyB
MKKHIAIILAASILTGCATTGANYTPIIDSKGSAPESVNADLVECQAYAKQTMDAASAAVSGAVVGSIIGAMFMAATGVKGYRNRAASMGAVSGGLSAAGAAETNQRDIIKRCMSGRGHSVLN